MLIIKVLFSYIIQLCSSNICAVFFSSMLFTNNCIHKIFFCISIYNIVFKLNRQRYYNTIFKLNNVFNKITLSIMDNMIMNIMLYIFIRSETGSYTHYCSVISLPFNIVKLFSERRNSIYSHQKSNIL